MGRHGGRQAGMRGGTGVGRRAAQRHEGMQAGMWGGKGASMLLLPHRLASLVEVLGQQGRVALGGKETGKEARRHGKREIAWLRPSDAWVWGWDACGSRGDVHPMGSGGEISKW